MNAQTKQPSQIQKIGLLTAAATGTALISSNTMAAGVADLGTAMTTEISGISAPILALFTAAISILAIFVGWRYLKRGANSA